MELVSKEMIDEVMAMFSDDIVATFNPSFIGPALPIMLRGETMWLDARTVPTLEQRHGCRMVIHMKRRDGQALISRAPVRPFRDIRKMSVYNYTSPKARKAFEANNWEYVSGDDEYTVADEYITRDADILFYGQP